MHLPFFLPQRFLPNHGFRFEQRPDACGFTLVEILVVIVILGILAALVVPRVLERPDEARVIAAKNDIAAILQAQKVRIVVERFRSGRKLRDLGKVQCCTLKLLGARVRIRQ